MMDLTCACSHSLESVHVFELHQMYAFGFAYSVRLPASKDCWTQSLNIHYGMYARGNHPFLVIIGSPRTSPTLRRAFQRPHMSSK